VLKIIVFESVLLIRSVSAYSLSTFLSESSAAESLPGFKESSLKGCSEEHPDTIKIVVIKAAEKKKFYPVIFFNLLNSDIFQF